MLEPGVGASGFSCSFLTKIDECKFAYAGELFLNHSSSLADKSADICLIFFKFFILAALELVDVVVSEPCLCTLIKCVLTEVSSLWLNEHSLRCMRHQHQQFYCTVVETPTRHMLREPSARNHNTLLLHAPSAPFVNRSGYCNAKNANIADALHYFMTYKKIGTYPILSSNGGAAETVSPIILFMLHHRKGSMHSD